MTAQTTRPVAVEELLRAWHAVQDGAFRHPARPQDVAPATPIATVAMPKPAERWTPTSGELVVPVVGAAGSCGATTVALALATVVEGRARVVECASASLSGLAAASTAELGADGAALRLYPDPNGDLLKHAVAEHFAEHGIEPAQVFVGNGSDEVLAHAFLALLKHAKPLLMPDITYSFYPVYCGLYDIAHTKVALDADFAVRVDDYLERADDCGGVIVANPNAPTGRPLSLSEIDRLCAGLHHAVVVIDEAYIDFGGETAAALIARHPNLLVVRTLSKSHALAGLRVGYALGQAPLIEALERVKNSFNSYPLDRLAIAGAVAAMEDGEYFERCCQAVIATRETLSADLTGLGFEVLPSAANFIFVRHPQRDAAELAKALRERSIIVRHFKLPRIDQFLRITIGTDGECKALTDALRQILG